MVNAETRPGDNAPGGGSREDWRKFWTDHSNCGGTWTYVNDPANPRVVCSCSLLHGQVTP